MSFCGLGITLSIALGILVLALAAQLCYFLWWRKKIRSKSSATQLSDIENNMVQQRNHHHHHNSKGLFHWGCWKILPGTVHADADSSATVAKVPAGQQEEKDCVLMSSSSSSCEEGVEAELMRLHNLTGPPRFLFTINEETKEDLLESEDGKSTRSSRRGSRRRSLSDLMNMVAANNNETPFLTPVSSSSPLNKCSFQSIESFNPLFESSEVVFRPSSSPPPKFKFLRDAEEKLYRRMIEEARTKSLIGFKDSSLATIEATEQKEFQRCVKQFPSQVLPLSSSPTTTTFLPLEKGIFHASLDFIPYT